MHRRRAGWWRHRAHLRGYVDVRLLESRRRRRGIIRIRTSHGGVEGRVLTGRRRGTVEWSDRVGEDAVNSEAAGRIVPAGNHLGNIRWGEMAKSSGVGIAVRVRRRVVDPGVAHGRHDAVHGRVVAIGARWRWRRRVVALSSLIVGVDIFLARVGVHRCLVGPH